MRWYFQYTILLFFKAAKEKWTDMGGREKKTIDKFL